MKALLSVHDKTDLEYFAKSLKSLGIELIATQGTKTYLEKHGIENITPTSEYTGFEKLLDGKIKTLDPNIHFSIATGEIGILAVNLIPLALEKDKPLDSMDIGGVSLIRSGVKNFENVVVIVNPDKYRGLISELRTGAIEPGTKRSLAIDAMKVILTYEWNVLEILKQL